MVCIERTVVGTQRTVLCASGQAKAIRPHRAVGLPVGRAVGAQGSCGRSGSIPARIAACCHRYSGAAVWPSSMPPTQPTSPSTRSVRRSCPAAMAPTRSVSCCRPTAGPSTRFAICSGAAVGLEHLAVLQPRLAQGVEDLGASAHRGAHLRDVPAGHAGRDPDGGGVLAQSGDFRLWFTDARHLGLERLRPSVRLVPSETRMTGLPNVKACPAGGRPGWIRGREARL